MGNEGLTPDKFSRLLAWLDTDRSAAGWKYEQIRLRLIKIFVCRGCATPEDLADATIDRVASKVETVASSYTGDPALYFYGVAKWIHHEYLKKTPPVQPATFEAETEPADPVLADECLDACMRKLEPEKRDLVLRYYEKDKSAKIRHRRELARKMGITVHSLRMQVHRIRKILEDCLIGCMGNGGPAKLAVVQ